MTPTAAVLIVAADHPSLDDAVAHFADGLRRERRWFGPSGAANPKPFPSLVDGLADRSGGFRLAAMDDGHVVGLARVDAHGDLLVAVTVSHRDRGIGTALLAATIERSRRHGYTRLTLRASHRSRPARALATAMGFTLVDHGRGRLDLIADLHRASHSA